MALDFVQKEHGSCSRAEQLEELNVRWVVRCDLRRWSLSCKSFEGTSHAPELSTMVRRRSDHRLPKVRLNVLDVVSPADPDLLERFLDEIVGTNFGWSHHGGKAPQTWVQSPQSILG